MKIFTRIITFLFCFFIAIIGYSQMSEGNYDQDWEYKMLEYAGIPLTELLGDEFEPVQQIHFIRTDKKGKKTHFHKFFNENGLLLDFYKMDEKKGKLSIVEYEYVGDKIKTSRLYKKGVLKSTTNKVWNDFGKLIETEKTKSNGKPVFRKTWEYNSDSCLVSSLYEKKGKTKRKWEYDYYSKSERSSSKLYNGKGKLLNVWSYDCKEEGEKLVEKDDTTQVCTWEEASSDYIIKVYQTFNDKGKARKHVRKFTKEDTLLVESTTYDENDEMTHRSTYDKSHKKPLTSEGFKNGKRTYAHEYKYENGRIVSYVYSYKNKVRIKQNNKYLEGRLIEQKRYDKKGRLTSFFQVEYKEF